MELKQLRSYVTVIEKESFSAAADALFLSQPTISNHVRMLEEELGCELISRTTKSFGITQTGEKIFTYAKSILDLEDRIRSSCDVHESRVIHIGASTIPSAYVLPELLAAYGKENPNIYFNIHQSDSRRVIEEFENGLYDVAVIGTEYANAHTICTALCDDHLVLIAPADERFLARDPDEPFPLEELVNEPIILREQGSGSLKLADAFLADAGIREENLHIVARINDQEAIKQMVLQGLGVSIISEKAVAGLVREKRLLAFELPGDPMSRSLYLIYKKKPSGEYVEDFVKFATKA